MTNKNDNAEDLYSPITVFKFSSIMAQMKQEESWEKNGRSARTLYKTTEMRSVLNIMKAGTEIKPHQANGPISVLCLEGELKFITEQGHEVLREGEMLTLKSFIRHSVEAIKEASFLLTVAPIRP